MSKKNNNKGEEKKNLFSLFFRSIGTYISKKYPFLILFIVGFLALSAINFAKISTNETVASFSIKDFEVGMIADRTIIADKSIPADDIDPISIEAGEKIIKKGFAITETGYAKLKKMISSPVYIDYRAFANNELFLFVLCITWYTLFSLLCVKRKVTVKEPVLQVIFFLIVYFAAAFGEKVQLFNTSYTICIILPCSLFAMLITILYGNKSAIVLCFAMAFGVLCAEGWELIPFLYSLVTSLTAFIVVRKIEKRIELMFASLILTLLNVLYMIVIIVIFNGLFNDPVQLIGVAINGFLSGILTLGLLTPLEFILNTASVFRLMDLSDLNNALMRKMCVTASGTYQHSMMVAQLAESACREIGANPLVARVGAYYHDIGKMDQSEYFSENQEGENKHDDINPTLSRSIIRSHVKKGVEKGHQLRLPPVIIDIIAEHHGNSPISYFYNKAKEKDPTLTPEDFAYNGNRPSSREAAVVMLADTVEAACRSLDNKSVPRLEKFITMLVNDKIDNNQLDSCDLTYRDISKVKEAFLQILAGFYHSRVKYPNQQDPDAPKDGQNNSNGQQEQEKNEKPETKDKKNKNENKNE